MHSHIIDINRFYWQREEIAGTRAEGSDGARRQCHSSQVVGGGYSAGTGAGQVE